jgi:hypothetical protein
MTPKEFQKLDIKKKAHHLSLLYFKGKCFCGRRPTPDYFKLRNTFLKAPEGDLTEMYTYLLDTKDRPPLTELWNCCRLHNEAKLQSHAVSDYERADVYELL